MGPGLQGGYDVLEAPMQSVFAKRQLASVHGKSLNAQGFAFQLCDTIDEARERHDIRSRLS
jgi:hypothetical protein